MNARHLMRLAGLPKSTKRELVRQFQAIGTLANELKADHNATLAKLDLDGGVTDTNFAALNSTTGTDVSLT
jgi:hypothetical protein